ncbi:MAG TPA: adenylate/guanylate cyclase domain-containing protein [Candidatus Acidoferrales bacterium]|jgi:adenylate cyclase|nr:adenylate/guanylate cyclase domain-containing protein [Candidatus Acidoferrales bacterium]
MKARVRVLIIALLLGALASAIGETLQLLPLGDAPFANRIADLVAHVSALDVADKLGFGQPAYDNEPNPNLGVITIDDITYQSMHFPFPRGYYGTLLGKLKAAGAKAVIFDIDFIDPSADPTQDAQFAAAMRQVPTVLAYTLNTSANGSIGEEKVAPTLAPYAKAVGYSTIDTPGGYFLGQPVEIDTGGAGTDANEKLFSLAAAGVQTYEGKPFDLNAIPKFDQGGGANVMLLLPPHITHTQSGNVETLNVPYLGRGYISFANAYNESVADLRPFANGALIYVGSTAAATFDFATTARGRIPGLFINARLADQMMRGNYMHVAPLWLDILLAFALPLFSALGFTFMRTIFAIATSVVATLVYAYINLFLFVKELYWVDLIHVVVAMLLGTMFVAVYRVIYEGNQKRMVTNLFGMHVSPEIVSDILDQDDPRSGLALTGKRVRATIFYSDIRGFTAMSETMTPEEIYGQLNEYFEEMCTIIFDYKGYVDKFIGDCVMAVFSAPYQRPDDPANAVISAVKQQDKIRELSAKWVAEGKREFTVGMGVNTGDVVMGNLGASNRMNYTVIGDNVNVAARLYNVAKGGEIIISEETYLEVKDYVDVDELEPVAVKGKVAPIKIYNVKGLSAAGAQYKAPE